MALPAYTRPNQRVIRRPVNPYDKSTIVSIIPKEIDEVKPTIDPGRFRIKAAAKGGFELLVVGPSSWFREIDPFQPLLEVINSSTEVADSIVKDYCNGLLGCDMAENMPGLFWIPGSFDKISIATYQEPNTGRKFSTILEEARAKQKNWYVTLVGMGDALWSNYNGHPMSINEDMKTAARELNLDKVWLATARDIEKSNCPFCGMLADTTYPICPNCKNIINKDRAKELGLVSVATK